MRDRRIAKEMKKAEVRKRRRGREETRDERREKKESLNEVEGGTVLSNANE